MIMDMLTVVVLCSSVCITACYVCQETCISLGWFSSKVNFKLMLGILWRSWKGWVPETEI